MDIEVLFCLREMMPLLLWSLFEAQKLKTRQGRQCPGFCCGFAASFSTTPWEKATLQPPTGNPQPATARLHFEHLFASSYFLVKSFFHGFLNNNKKDHIYPKYIDSKHTPYQRLPSIDSLCYLHHVNQENHPRNTPEHTGGTSTILFSSIGTSAPVWGLGSCQTLLYHFLSPLSTSQIQTCCKTT